MGRRPGGVHECRIALHLLDHLLVFLIGLHRGNANPLDLNAPEVPPLGGELLLQGSGQLLGVAGQGGIADALLRDPGEGWLKGGEQLAFQLAVQLHAVVILRHVAADVGIEQERIDQLVAVLSEAANGNVDVDAGPLVHHPEGHGRGGAVLVPDELLGVEVIHPLILGGLAAKGEPLAHGLEGRPYALPQVPSKDGGLGGHVVGVLAGFGADVHHLALLHDHHALPVGNGDDRAVRDDVVASLGVAGAAGGALLPLHRQHVRGDGLTVKILLPLVGQHAARRTQCSFNQSHNCSPFHVQFLYRSTPLSKQGHKVLRENPHATPPGHLSHEGPRHRCGTCPDHHRSGSSDCTPAGRRGDTS